ncbi:unnamed protein product [Mytilus coruscus]|uniref:Uncharacterized protein n=1 Tax=Mytilus coruscus TaxID=42192 RepID=A0A6J8DSU1_MYTCO|nr:unnamed protein product [Mytilus coruscus]
MADNSGDETTYINSLKNANTIRKTLSDINILTQWIRGNDDIRSLEDIPVMELDKILARFFMKITTDDGSPYEPTNGKSLIRTVWMNNSLHFGLRSREEHSTPRWGDLQMKSTTDGLQYLEHTEKVTNTRTGTNVRETRAFQAKMFADPGTYTFVYHNYNDNIHILAV